MEGSNCMSRRGSGLAGLILALWIAGASFGFMQEHVGNWSVPCYVGMVALILMVGLRSLQFVDPWMHRNFWWVLVACLVGLMATHLSLHPFEDGRGPLRSSDRDEALEQAVGRWLKGDYPYYLESSVAGPLSVLPGGILLALPFVIVGKVGLINVFWLAGFLWVLRKEFGSASLALWLLVWSIGVCPAALYEFVSGGDVMANGIYVAVGVWGCLRLWSADTMQIFPAVFIAAFFGVAVASRANFPLICPLVMAWIWQRSGWRRAVSCAAVTGGVSLGLILGFYWWDPESFTPFLSRSKLMIPGASEWAGMVVLGMTILGVLGVSITFLARRQVEGRSSCFRACAWITLLPILGTVLISSAVNHRMDFSILHDRFGLMWVPFALLGWGEAILPQRCEGADLKC